MTVAHRRKFCNTLTETFIFCRFHYKLQKVLNINRNKHLEKARRMEKSGEKPDLSGEELLLRPFILISYDLTTVSAAKKVKISRFVHGYQSTKVIDGIKKTYSYTGVREKFGVRIVSKGTILVPEQNKKEILSFLDNNGIDYEQLPVRLHRAH